MVMVAVLMCDSCFIITVVNLFLSFTCKLNITMGKTHHLQFLGCMGILGHILCR